MRIEEYRRTATVEQQGRMVDDGMRMERRQDAEREGERGERGMRYTGVGTKKK